ncbi:unnamed protein product [Medioppia subpectinata]|uniref:Large ribosomal subunit protein mL54 n=1 Tax=Medioppia subpectinata TaxID=1979941 RepID=A0A7R9Q6V9_9ACAR|nr:unnamed protein product [Medioppia subpectinata]CAG2115045.1 unnamed protein product [Medioppia subpectinata]
MSLTKAFACLSKPYKTCLLGYNVAKRCPPQRILVRSLAAAPPVSSGAQPIGQRRFRLPVETDADKLVNHCCGANYMKEGEEIPLKPDEEYPEWIWSLRLNYPPPVHELDPNTKEYYERLAVVGQQREWRQRKLTRQRFKVVSDRIERLEELRYRRRFRALAHKEFDAGYEVVAHSEREDYWDLEAKERFREPDEPKPFYPGVDTVEMPHEVAANRLRLRDTKKCGHYGW